MTTPKKRPLSPGDFVQATCTRCKKVLRHTIVALVEGRPARVTCNTCGGEHVYHPASGQSGKRSSPGKSAASSSRQPRTRQTPNTLAQEWANQLEAAGAHERRSYAPTATFRSGQVMEHPTFGAGVVQRILEPGKVLVLFSSGAKTLVCGKG